MSNADVSNCVSLIIHAFTNGLDIFKRLRERRRRKKNKVQAQPDPSSGDELQLSNSLRKGPLDIQTHYERNYEAVGERFAKGDAIAHASLAETLIKLNTGLVGIIASFLNSDRKEHLHLDYKSLTNLSEASRTEAVDSLNQLYQRLSHSNINLYQPKIGCPRCGSSKHANCGAVATRHTSTYRHSNTEKRKQQAGKAGSTRSRSNTPTIVRMPLKSSSQSQLVVVRPRNRRTTSSSSASSSRGSTKSPSNASTALTTPYASPLASPEYTTMDPFQFQVPPTPKIGNQKPSASPRRKSAPAPEQRPQTWPHAKPDTSSIPVMSKPPKPQTPHKAYPPYQEKQPFSPITPKYSSVRPTNIPRRLDKATPSAYSFASDSTKLGEIPMRKWTIPFDFEAMDRLNAEAMANGWTPGMPEPKLKPPKRRLFGFLRRGEGASS
ncbi:hypothetical protein K432DRAFT_331697 [Lepidopterella palustris CBS 459.81]|uniref:Uncharacterized protein n=1 Tax=Lepidopterella palustris CBS 459.81 TaxID=1314670 RepID=A0A8E2E7K4_9PEZI|nr:hypothetical protein K432DRAFT_331697 [Lepidopterella palustris CBS 459.81]